MIIVSPAYGSKRSPEEGGKNMRNRDFLPFHISGIDIPPGGAQYLNFFELELIPFVESNFRVLPGDRTLWGFSFSGIFAVYALFQKPNLFQRYIIVDGYRDECIGMEESYASHHTDLPIRLCISASPSEPLGKKLFDMLRVRKYANLQSEYELLNDIGHAAVGAEGLTKGLVSVFSKTE